jgi:homoserine kinase
MDWAQDPVRVRVPATSANLGPGFDALGMALTLHDEVDAWISESGLSIEISGEGADLADAGEKHLVVRAMRAAFALVGGQPPGLGLRCVNRIPHGRGLGSSAAAIIAGILAARALAGANPKTFPDGTAFPDGTVLGLATSLEGHPDNVAACLAGGLTIAWMTSGGPHMVRLDPLPSILPVVCVAPASVRTDVARGLLPNLVSHQDAAANAGRSALLIAALTQRLAVTSPGLASPGLASPDLASGMNALFDATQDRLHQDYRAAAMPETDGLVRRLREKGIAAVVSGAGPSVLALLATDEAADYGRHLDSLGSIVRETGIAWHITSLEVERHGARVLRPGPSRNC